MLHDQTTYFPNPFLIAYPGERGGSLIFEDFFAKRKFEIFDKEIIIVLSLPKKAITKNQLLSLVTSRISLDRKDAKALVDQIIQLGLFISAHSDQYKKYKKGSLWRKQGWGDALDYYMSIYDYPFLDYAQKDARMVDNVRMAEYAREKNPPSIYKDYKKSEKILLECDFNTFDSVDINKILLEEVVDAPPSPLQLTKKQIADFLLYSVGKIGTVDFVSQGTFIMKTSPSGGARHPIEAYVALFDSEYPAGLYHYSVRSHALELIRPGNLSDEISDILYELKTGPQFSPKAVMFYSSCFDRSMWRYREPRSYRVVLNDLGHILETTKLVARGLGMKTYYGHGFFDDKLEKFIGISKPEESILKFAAIA